MIEQKIYSVSQINHYIKGLMERDFILNSLWVRGEISNFKYHTSGHMYFTLKDQNAAIRCVMFQMEADMLPFLPENGMSVILYGYVTIYEKTGQYQLYVQLMEPEGIGALNVAFEQLKNKLSEEGLFDEDYKREICPYPRCVAVITSPTGAAVRDIIQISQRRNPSVQIVVCPALVQGDKAADSIVEALHTVNDWNAADTIILGRGGGSAEDLWPFNEEKVARAIFASRIPVISAVGHETDFTIADFVADLRAPTPSAAAELAVNDANQQKERLEELFSSLESAVAAVLYDKTRRLNALWEKPIFQKPFDRIFQDIQYLDTLERNLNWQWEKKLLKNQNQFQRLLERLEALSPLAVLKRGYAVVNTQEGNVVQSVSQVNVDDMVKVLLSDGAFYAQVKEKVDDHGDKEKKL